MSSVSSVPSTMMRPESCRSSWLIVLSSVDLPEPEGPMMTTTSPSLTDTSMSFSAMKSPKRFTTFSIRTISFPFPFAICCPPRGLARLSPSLSQSRFRRSPKPG